MELFKNMMIALVFLILGHPTLSFAGPLEDDPTTSECASTQPELRKIFPVEMDLLKSFEGLYSDIPERKNNAIREGLDPDKMPPKFDSKSISFNANKNTIEFQLWKSGNDVRKERVEKVKKVKVCKTRQGMMRVLGEDLEIDIQVHSNLQAIIREGKTWRKYFRISTVHGNFRPPQDTLKEDAGADQQPAKEFKPSTNGPGVG